MGRNFSSPFLLRNRLETTLPSSHDPLDIVPPAFIITSIPPIEIAYITVTANRPGQTGGLRTARMLNAICSSAFSERPLMAPRRLSRLQRRILQCLVAEYQRTQGGTSLGHRELVQTLGRDPGNISHSVRTLEARGVITVGRTPGGKADYLVLTRAGLHGTSEMGLSTCINL